MNITVDHRTWHMIYVPASDIASIDSTMTISYLGGLQWSIFLLSHHF